MAGLGRSMFFSLCLRGRRERSIDMWWLASISKANVAANINNVSFTLSTLLFTDCASICPVLKRLYGNPQDSIHATTALTKCLVSKPWCAILFCVSCILLRCTKRPGRRQQQDDRFQKPIDERNPTPMSNCYLEGASRIVLMKRLPAS